MYATVYVYVFICKVNPSSMHTKLVSNMDLLTSERRDKKLTFLLPIVLEGDLKHLINAGHMVIGIAPTKEKCHSIFGRVNLEYDVVMENSLTVFKAKNSSVKLISGSSMDVITSDALSKEEIDCVWDAGSLLRVIPIDRSRYVTNLKALLNKRPFTYLLYSAVFSSTTGRDSAFKGMDVNDIKTYFGADYKITVLEKTEPGPLKTLFEPRKTFEGYEILAFITPKEEGDKIDYWQDRYVNERSQWHTGEVFWSLEKYYDKLTGGKKHRFLMPMCGKAYDLIWLYKRGHAVVGVEGVYFVAESVFKDHGIKYTNTYLPQIKGHMLKSDDGRLIIYSCDYYNVNADVLGGKFAVGFESSCFGSINIEDRERYAKLTRSLLADDFKYMMKVYFYEGTTYKGPPYCIRKELLDELFGVDGAKVEFLDELEFSKTAKEREGVDFETCAQTVYLIYSDTKK